MLIQVKQEKEKGQFFIFQKNIFRKFSSISAKSNVLLYKS